LAFSISFALNCGRGDTCAEGSTCCKTASNYGCCAGRDAVCCADAKSCCPGSTKCDLKRNKCIPLKIPNIEFLMDDDNLDNITSMTNSTLFLSLNDSALMIDGFMFAANFSGYVKTYETCKYHHLKLTSDVIDLVYNIKDFQKFPDIATALSAIFWGLGDVFTGTFNNYFLCQDYSKEVPKLIEVLKTYFSNPNYFKTFYNNIMEQTYFFLSQWAKTQAMFEQKKYFEAGKAFGELFMVAIFPEIKEVKTVRLLARENSKERDYFDIIKCLVKESGLTINDVRGFDAEKINSMLPKIKDAFSKCRNIN